MSDRIPTAVVLGGSLAGLLTASALDQSGFRVTVVERDALPDAPGPRRGLPQARHAHQLWSGGARAMERLLPGAVERLRAAGVNRVPVTTDMVALSPHGWYRRWAESAYMLPAGRDLLDWVVRRLVLADGRIGLLERTEAVGLAGSAGGRGGTVTGVRLRGPASGGEMSERTLTASLVVDCTGRGSRAPRWLRDLGLPEPDGRQVDSRLMYASRSFRAPEGARGRFPVVNIELDPRGGRPGSGGVLMPTEDGTWMATLILRQGGRPAPDAEDFVRYAREELRHPVIGELLACAEPLTGVALTRTTANRRHFFERMPVWPENFVVLGDAVCALNPVYGHGMSVAAQSALALRDVIAERGPTSPGLSRRLQKAVGRTVRAAWDLAIGADVFHPGATATGPTARDRLLSAYVGRLVHTATGNGRIARRLTDVTSLERGTHTLLTPSMLLAAAAGPLRPPLPGPPLTPEERKSAGIP